MTSRSGLTAEQAAAKAAQYGLNRIEQEREETFLEELFQSLREPLVLLLLGVAVLYVIFGELRDAIIIFGVILTVAITESSIEWRAGRAIKSLSNLAEPRVLVWRDGKLAELPSEQLVPGDVIELRTGVRIPADAHLLESDNFWTDESLVTGESGHVSHGPISGTDAILGGTLVARGSGVAEVVAIGSASTLGKIAALAAGTKDPKTPLQLQMAQLARTLLIVAFVTSAVIPIIGVFAGRPVREMLLTGLSLAFATIPEELPVLIIVVLGFGSLRLAQRGAIVRRLRAAETLGAVTVICTDKTGTLTENRMEVLSMPEVERLLAGTASGSEKSASILKFAALASERSDGESAIIDPIDAAVWNALNGQARPEMQHFAFDSELRIASGFEKEDGHIVAGVKGSPEAVLSRCKTYVTRGTIVQLDPRVRSALLAAAQTLGRNGRVLAVASQQRTSPPATREDIESDLVFEGLMILRDPVRAQVPEAIKLLRSAGVAVSMVTGDQPTTAESVSREAGLLSEDVVLGTDLQHMTDEALVQRARAGLIVARALPADKLRLVTALQTAGEVVMVTGDGANDAPALSAAAVGVAMGRVGSDAAREAADVVLTDDNFATLERAVAEGRRLFDNFRKAIRFYLAVKVALVLATAIAAILALPLPFTPVQIVILELFMDLGASLAFIALPAEPDVMSRPPRNPAASFLDKGMLIAIAAGGTTLAALVFGSFLFVLHTQPVASARTAALIAWMIGHVVLGAVMAGSGAFGALRKNLPMALWLEASVAFALAIVAVPGLREALAAGALPWKLSAAIAAISALIPLWLAVVISSRRSFKASAR